MLCGALFFLTCTFFGRWCPAWETHPFADSQVKANKNSALALVLIVLDGVRIQEFFSHKSSPPSIHSRPRRSKVRQAPLWPFLWGELAKKKHTLILGDKELDSHCYVNNQYYISLPAYADMFSGIAQSNVTSNQFHSPLNCPSIIDRLIDLGMPAKDFALFASWQHIEKVVSRDNRQNIYIDTGYKSSGRKPPWKDARFDRYLQKDIISYLKKNKHKPRFLKYYL